VFPERLRQTSSMAASAALTTTSAACQATRAYVCGVGFPDAVTVWLVRFSTLVMPFPELLVCSLGCVLSVWDFRVFVRSRRVPPGPDRGLDPVAVPGRWATAGKR